jgi:hypothetical protein
MATNEVYFVETVVTGRDPAGKAVSFKDDTYAVASFVSLDKKTSVPGYDSEPKYKMDFLIKKGTKQDLAIREAIKDILRKSHGQDAGQQFKKLTGGAPDWGSSNALPYRDGDLTKYNNHQGHMVLIAKTTAAPTVWNGRREQLQPKEIYDGCYVNAKITFMATKTGGVSAILNGVQFVAHGTPVTGGQPATADDFPELEVTDAEGVTYPDQFSDPENAPF